MKTLKLNYKRAIYSLKRLNDEGTTKDYILSKVDGERSEFFTEIIRIEKDNGFHRRSRFFDNWIYLRNDTNWKRCIKSGLAFTGHKFIYEGNVPICIQVPKEDGELKKVENAKHFFLVQFSQDFKFLILDMYEDFYPNKRELIQWIISGHPFYFKRYRKGA